MIAYKSSVSVSYNALHLNDYKQYTDIHHLVAVVTWIKFSSLWLYTYIHIYTYIYIYIYKEEVKKITPPLVLSGFPLPLRILQVSRE